jgi:hypothetical protein
MFKLCCKAIDYISRRAGSIIIEMNLEPAMGG